MKKLLTVIAFMLLVSISYSQVLLSSHSCRMQVASDEGITLKDTIVNITTIFKMNTANTIFTVTDDYGSNDYLILQRLDTEDDNTFGFKVQATSSSIYILFIDFNNHELGMATKLETGNIYFSYPFK